MTSEVNIINGLLHGSYKIFFDNGSPKLIGNYIEGKKHGIFEFISEDGAILNKEEYIDGLADGEFMNTYQDGLPKERSIYSKGNLVSQIKYNFEELKKISLKYSLELIKDDLFKLGIKHDLFVSENYLIKK